MPDIALRQIDPNTGQPPRTRVANAASLNEVVKKIIARDLGSALARQDVQQSVDGAPPFNEQWMVESGQEGRCNLNFGDMKREVRKKQLGYYDLTDSVPILGIVNSEFGTDVQQRFEQNMIMSEELHRSLKDWANFNVYHQLLVQKFCTHGIGVLYRFDDVDWKWGVAGLEDFKTPRGTTIASDELDIACIFRDVTVGKLYSWIADVEENDPRWNLTEVKTALLKANDSQLVFSVGAWEKYQQMLKNNDIWASTMAQDVVKLVHVWIKEYSGKISNYLTLRNGGNTDFLFKVENKFDSIENCFQIFPYEVGSNGTLHSIRGRAHEIYPEVQVLNTLRGQGVDNARLAGSMVLQPKTANDMEDMGIIFHGGAVWIPPSVTIQNSKFQNPSDAMLPIIQDMSMLLRDEGKPSIPPSSDAGSDRKTKYEVQDEQAREAILDSAQLTLFYDPWKRHLNETWRRFRNPHLTVKDPGGRDVFDFRRRCMARGVSHEALIDSTSWIEPMRAIGGGSPGNRLMTFDQAMQYYGSLDPMGQNNLLRNWFAQRVGYAQVDMYVPRMGANGRQPLDGEIAELQNVAMSAGRQMSVRPNDQHIIHLQKHFPDLDSDLTSLESNQAGPEMLPVVEAKLQHSQQHIQLLVPDKLQEVVVKELRRQFNNLRERVSAAIEHYQREQAQGGGQQQPGGGQAPAPDPAEAQKLQHREADHQQKTQHREEDHQAKLKNLDEMASETRAIKDADNAAKITERQNTARQQFTAGTK